MFYPVIAYFKYLYRSTNQHGVHSPFVYNLVTKCFYDRKKYPAYSILSSYRKELRNNKSVLNMKDFGAGSRVFSGNQRKVNDIAKYAGMSAKRQKLLFRIANYLDITSSLELGTSLGLATVPLCLVEGNKVTTIEGCPETADFTAIQLATFLKNTPRIITASFDKGLEQLKSKKWDLIFLDGDHTKEGTLNYFEKLVPYTHNETIFIIDDINWSRDMASAWAQIKQNPAVTVTIDTFNWGIIFFRKEQRKESFTIRL